MSLLSPIPLFGRIYGVLGEAVGNHHNLLPGVETRACSEIRQNVDVARSISPQTRRLVDKKRPGRQRRGSPPGRRRYLYAPRAVAEVTIVRDVQIVPSISRK